MAAKNFMVGRLRSFRFALRGLAAAVGGQPNARIHLAAAVLVAAAGLAFRISWIEAGFVASALVWVAELLNTAIEHVTDLVAQGQHPLAGKAKDVAAAAVLIAAAYALLMGASVFGPRVFSMLKAML